MQIVHLSRDRERSFRIGVDIGQYHFVTADGYREEWITMTAREWWKKQLWLKDGGYNQDSDTYTSRNRRANSNKDRT